VDIRQQSFPVGEITALINDSMIELWRPKDFQRLGGLWTDKQKSLLIESILMNIPLPIFYLDGSKKPWKIIDGLQRLTVLDEFINRNGFSLSDLQYDKTLEGLRFLDLPYIYRRAILNFRIEAYIINPGTPEAVKFNIFQRINTSGIRLNPQELRNAYYSGIATNFINELVELPSFREAIGKHISSKRMKDRELALRFVAFFHSYDFYSPPTDTFLDIAMEEIRGFGHHEFSYINGIFDLSLRTCYTLFGEDAFFILNRNGNRLSSRPNISLFEAWTVNLAARSKTKHSKLIENRDEMFTKYLSYFHIPEFYSAITSGTTSKKAVELRFSMISDLIDTSL